MRTEGLVLRPLLLSDYDRVLELWRSCEGVGLNESDTREAIGRFLERNPGLSLVAEVKATIVGAVLCGHDGRRGYLHHLAVAGPYRRRGLASAMVDRCLAELNAAGIPKCNIFLYRDNISGRDFWLRQHWKLRDDLLVVQKNTA